MAGKTDLVRDQDQVAVFLAQIIDYIENSCRDFRVQGRGWLVK